MLFLILILPITSALDLPATINDSRSAQESASKDLMVGVPQDTPVTIQRPAEEITPEEKETTHS